MSGYYGSQPTIHADGSVTFRGVDLEGRKATVHQLLRDTLVVKISGGSGWAGRGASAYYPAKFVVMARKDGRGPWDEVVSFPLKGGGGQARRAR